jgi:putative transposase
MCEILRISRNSYYQWQRNSNKIKISKTKILKAKINQIWIENRKVYGSYKITKILARAGYNYHPSYISRLMQQMGIRSQSKRKYVVTTNSNHNFSISPNILNRNFKIKELGKVWVSDITYIRCKDKWIYLTTMIDLADRKIVGWSLSDDMTVENTVYKAWARARKNRPISDDFIFHSDRGVQYAAGKMTAIFRHNKKINQSMSRKGNCWDNAVAESFFKTIKCELIYRRSFKTFIQAYIQINTYIHWYNNKRIHQSLDYLTPLEMEMKLKNIKTKRAA